MSSWARLRGLEDRVLTSKYNKPFPVTLLPSAIGYYLGYKQGKRQRQILEQIRALDEKNDAKVEAIADHPI
ncbi:hypothetical protein B0A48_08099 [Cryoendolithus antarcticus]|uniref:Uncharacterized protein n=1 Tax=Cryoendolithus antarcticus TaxID=1507870 RepID=A0A1V8T188_9PEZI|nr:hypothetical protein B0A48_08099 [Cryoendolithus antarcticus]